MPKIKEKVSDILGGVEPATTCDVPFWKGPESDEEMGGVTQSLLGGYLLCRERSRLRLIEGISPPDKFNKNMGYGSMWHECEKGLTEISIIPYKREPWQKRLMDYTDELCRKYPLDQPTILHWYRVCQMQFPLYVEHYRRKDKRKREWFFAEEAFKIPYELPDGRKVWMRGKMDGGFKQARKKRLRENKTKGDIKEERLIEQLGFDLQTLFYLTAYNVSEEHPGTIYDIEYNVVRRPLSGGKGSIRKHKATSKKPAETDEHFFGRLKAIIEEDPDNFFMRWDVQISPTEAENFRKQFLNPILTQLCNWYDWVKRCAETGGDPFDNPIHWRHPFGVYNVVNEGGSHELDTYIATGSEVGLERGRPLFSELEDG